MSSTNQTLRFYISPDKQKARWMNPAERNALNPDWVDVTDWPDDDLVAYLEAGSSN